MRVSSLATLNDFVQNLVQLRNRRKGLGGIRQGLAAGDSRLAIIIDFKYLLQLG